VIKVQIFDSSGNFSLTAVRTWNLTNFSFLL
jgi:hypothetical protein